MSHIRALAEVGWWPSPKTCHEPVRSLNASTPPRNPLYLIERDCPPIPFTQEEKMYFSKTASLSDWRHRFYRRRATATGLELQFRQAVEIILSFAQFPSSSWTAHARRESLGREMTSVVSQERLPGQSQARAARAPVVY